MPGGFDISRRNGRRGTSVLQTDYSPVYSFVVSRGEPAEEETKNEEEKPMKKFLALIAALTLMMTGIVLAEGVPAPHFGGQTETADSHFGTYQGKKQEYDLFRPGDPQGD